MLKSSASFLKEYLNEQIYFAKKMREVPLIGKFRYKSSKLVKGRNDYECCECNAILGKGAQHQYTKGMWGFSELEYRTCLNCTERWDELKSLNPNFNFSPFMNGDLNEATNYIATLQMAC